MRIRIAARLNEDLSIPLVRFGPAADALPPQFDAFIEYDDQPIRLTIGATFDGRDRVQVSALTIERTDGASLTPHDLVTTRLAWVMNRAIKNALQPKPEPVDHRLPEQSGPLTGPEMAALARLYWTEYVSWGEPRQAVMRAFQLPRSTANYWIRKTRELYDLPGDLQT